jgi:hypothetical protein
VFQIETHTSEMTLVARGRQSYRCKPCYRNKASKFQPRNKCMIQSKFEGHNRKDDDCFYCGKPSHIAKDCYKRKANVSK